MSKIILLNGCGSSGKTSIARSIQHLSQELWLRFGLDTFIDMIPPSKMDAYLKFIPGNNEKGAIIDVISSAEAKKLFDLMPKFAEIFASTGNNLIIDEVLFNEKLLQLYRENLNNHNLYYIGVFCKLEAMQEREFLRGDRALGLSNAQIEIVHKGKLNSYDFTIDTTKLSPFEAARLILDFIDKSTYSKDQNVQIDEMEKIFQLELALLKPVLRRDLHKLDSLIADNFYEIGASGATYNKEDILKFSPNEKDNDIYGQITDFEITYLAANLIRANYNLKEKAKQTKRTSIWQKIHSNYQMIFHQGS
jgi:chloramphenicol 3-O phosphotransferase